VLTPSREQNIATIVATLDERMSGTVDRSTIEAEVRLRYDELCATSTFDDFIPVLAARLSLDDLRGEGEPESAGELAARLTAASADANADPGTDPARATAEPSPPPSIPITGR
jgi:hypothetical protein